MQLLNKDIMQYMDAQRKDSEDWGGTLDLSNRSWTNAENPMHCTSAPQMQWLHCSLGPKQVLVLSRPDRPTFSWTASERRGTVLLKVAAISA